MPPQTPLRGTRPSLESGEDSWGPSYWPEAPSPANAPRGSGFRSPAPGAAANRAEGAPGRDSKPSPRPRRAPHRSPPEALHTLPEARGGLSGPVILPGTVRAGGEGAPRTRSRPPPRTLSALMPTSVTGPSGLCAEPRGRARDVLLAATRRREPSRGFRPGRERGGACGLPAARGGGEPARRSRRESLSPRPDPCRRRHLPGRQLGMRRGPAPGLGINNPGGWGGRGKGGRGCAGAAGEARGEGRAAGAGAGGRVGKGAGHSSAVG